jgi:hypothetical protein
MSAPDNMSANDNGAVSSGAEAMRIFIFKSEARPDLRAFGGDPGSDQLPSQFRPWHAIGVVAAGRDPPCKLSRAVIEAAIKEKGFQLWRMSKKD